MAALRTEILLDGYGVTESLRWHDGALWFSDLTGGGVHRWTPDGPDHVVDIPGRAGGLGWLPDGRLLAVSMDERAVYRVEGDGTVVLHAALGDHAGGHANDMLVDGTGRAFVGNFGFDYHAVHRTQANAAMYAPPGPPSTAVVTIDPDGTVVGAGPQMLFPNGMVALPGGTLVVAETLRMRLTECDVDERGVLVRPRPWAETIPAPLWRALTSAGAVGRVARKVSAALDHPAIAQRSSSPWRRTGSPCTTTARRSGWPTPCATRSPASPGAVGSCSGCARASRPSTACSAARAGGPSSSRRR